MSEEAIRRLANDPTKLMIWILMQMEAGRITMDDIRRYRDEIADRPKDPPKADLSAFEDVAGAAWAGWEGGPA